MRKQNLLLAALVLLLAVLAAGFIDAEAASEEPTPAAPPALAITVADNDPLAVEDEADCRAIYDLACDLRARAAAPEGPIQPPDGALVYTLRFSGADEFALQTWADGPVLFYTGDVSEDAAAVFTADDADVRALMDHIAACLPEPTADAPEDDPADETPPVEEAPAETDDPLPASDDALSVPAAETDDPIDESAAETESPASDEPEIDASAEPDAASAEPDDASSEPPAETTAELGSYTLSAALGTAPFDTYARDDGQPPVWSGETEHVGAEIVLHYAPGMAQTDFGWQRWWTDETRTESATAEEFENARAFYRESMPRFQEGLSVNGCDAFFYDLADAPTLLWYDAERDTIFQLTAYVLGPTASFDAEAGDETPSAAALVALAEQVADA